MPVSAIVAIAALVIIAVVVVIAVSVAAARRRRLRRRFGAEYDRAVAETKSRRQAAAALTARLRRARDLDIRPLSGPARAVYLRQWVLVQERFVDQPDVAVAQASQLIGRVLSDRGYATNDDDQLLADLSVDHAQALENYRSAKRLSQPSAGGGASTEDLRQAMINYRTMFADLLGEHAGGDEPTSGGSPGPDGAANGGSGGQAKAGDAEPPGALADGPARDRIGAEEERAAARDASAQARKR